MATDPRCDVQVGVHPGPFWVSKDGLRVCDRHRQHFNERVDEFGPYNWKPQPEEGASE